jgi:hypothetical protein
MMPSRSSSLSRSESRLVVTPSTRRSWLKRVHPAQQVSHDEQRPAVPDDVQRCGDRTSDGAFERGS